MFDTLRMLSRFAAGLPDFYRNRISPDQAEDIVRQCIRRREQNFLSVVRTAVFDNPKSPYLWLFQRASCEYGDVQELVREGGVEHALARLRAQGFFVKFEEFKGRSPIRRGCDELAVRPADFFNPYLANAYESSSGGNTGARTRIPHDLDHMHFQAAQQSVTQNAHGVLGVPTAIWCGLLPDGSGVNYILRSGHIGATPSRWFSPTSLWQFDRKTLKFQIATLVPLLGARLAGLPVPFPQKLDVADAVVVAQWAHTTVKQTGTCLVNSSVSRAVRVCSAARDAGIDLTGTTFRVSGEPMSPAKADRVRDSGARFYTSFAVSEAGRVAEGCAAPCSPSDVHVLTGFCGMIAYPRDLPGQASPVSSLHLTTLLPQAPIIMLNVEMDDCGTLEKRSCGCPLDSLGMDTHLKDIYSYDKLTAEGVTLVGSDMVNILENVLPEAVGGSSQDYQFLESEDEQGVTRLSLLIGPAVPPVGEDRVREVLLQALRSIGPSEAQASTLLKQAKSLVIERRRPIWTDRGKLLTLYKSRNGHGGPN